jgi:hypothetical protein
MTQRDIDRAVARATGETVGRVQQMGFILAVIPPQPIPRRYSATCTRSSAKPPLRGRPFAGGQAVQT